MANQPYNRPKEGFRFAFGGLKTNAQADTLPPDKYPMAINVRGVSVSSVRTRPNLRVLYQIPLIASRSITDIRAYSELNTDNLPVLLARASDDRIYGLVNSVPSLVGTLTGAGGSLGVSMIPFRPNQSANPYMFIANGQDYQKFSAPDATTGTITQQKAGIIEPQQQCNAVVSQYNSILFNVGGGAGSFTAGGTAGASSNGSRLSDTVGKVFPDPDQTAAGRYVFGVTLATGYQRQMYVTVGGNATTVDDVLPAIPVPIGIRAILYDSGTTGTCVIVPNTLAQSQNTEGESILTDNFIATVRRGSLIQFSGGGGETCFVRSVTVGPDGSVCFATSTTVNHTTAETFTGVPAIATLGITPVQGQAILSPDVTFSNTSGVGNQTQNFTISSSLLSFFQQDDYIHFSIRFDDLTLLNECKIMFDIDDGSFTKNFYYYAVRPNDIVAGIANTLTQIGVAQIVSQRRAIDEERAFEAKSQGKTASSAQTAPGTSQWSEIMFPIRELTRVGGDQSKSLMNVTKVRLVVNSSGTVAVAFNSITIVGGFSPDVGTTAAPYNYRIRPRNSITGTKGNPSPPMRYVVNPRRQPVYITIPDPATTAALDPQIDVWDVFRYGGTVTSWRYIGQALASSNTVFIDNFSDAAALAGEELETDNYEPWPTVDVPLNAVASQVVGTTVLLTVPAGRTISNYLPGNLIRLSNGNVYTLRFRPQRVFNTQWKMELMENAGSLTNATLMIYEPDVANSHQPYLWGPDAAGTVFGVGDTLRPGTVSYTKNNQPESVPDKYNQEITPPTEPLMGGVVLDGLSFVASTERWWAMYPQPQNPLQRYSVIQQPIPRGVAAPYAVCTDGRSIYFVAKDGIWSSSQGSLTDADLYNIFPHEGVNGGVVPGQDYSYAGIVVHSPDYSRAGRFRLSYSNYYLYFIYPDSAGTYHCLTYDTRRGAWVMDDYTNQNGQLITNLAVTCVYHVEQQAGSLLTDGTATYPRTVMGTNVGYVTEQGYSNDLGVVNAFIATREWDGGDARASEQWGDVMLDCAPQAPAGITVTPLALGAQVSAPVVVPTSLVRAQSFISLGGGILSNFLGISASWIETENTSPTELFLWQPSFIDKPETIADRDTDWYFPPTGSSFWQGFVLRADTFNIPKGLQVRDGDSKLIHSFTPIVLHNGETSHAYSFDAPFQAYSVRIEPTDQVPWRFFDVEWIYEDSPEAAQTWVTQGTSFGLTGYMHIKQISAAYMSTVPITLALTTYDGLSPAPITLPSTGGALQKITFQLTPNKGQLYFFSATASAPFSLYLPDWEILVGKWGRVDGYLRYSKLGGEKGDKALV